MLQNVVATIFYICIFIVIIRLGLHGKQLMYLIKDRLLALFP